MIVHLTNYTLHLGIKKNFSSENCHFAKPFNKYSEKLLEFVVENIRFISILTLVFVEKIGRIHVVRSTVHV